MSKSSKKSQRRKIARKVSKQVKAAEITVEQPSAEIEAAPAKPDRSFLVKRIVLGAIYGMTAVAIVLAWPQARQHSDAAQLVAVHAQYDALIARVEKLQTEQLKQKRSVIDDGILEQTFQDIQADTLAGKFGAVRKRIKRMNATVGDWEVALAKRPPGPTLQPGPSGENHSFAPILLYHHPPADLEQQFQYLVDHGYSCVTLKQVAEAMAGGPGLPARPVVITFDDGFADQMAVLPLLQRYHLTAVYYIIDGGAGSGYHIGANRRVPDPQGGDDYLTWDQIRELDHSGIIEIAGHTINHLLLSGETESIQRREIIDAKAELEAQIGHSVYNLAYPYGGFNQTSIDLARQAGYLTAVTTLPGTDQSVAGPFTLRRIRDAKVLP